MRLITQFQRFKDEFEPTLFREFVRQLEQVFAQITIDTTKVETVVTAATYTIAREDSLILCDTTSNDIDITIGLITDNLIRDRREFTFSKVTIANIVTIHATSPDTILGDTSAELSGFSPEVLRIRATTYGWVPV